MMITEKRIEEENNFRTQIKQSNNNFHPQRPNNYERRPFTLHNQVNQIIEDLIEALTPLSIIEDQAPRVKRAQRNLADHEALLAKKNSNKQEAKELA